MSRLLLFGLLSLLILQQSILGLNASNINNSQDWLIGFKGEPDELLIKNSGGIIKHKYWLIPAIAATRLPPDAIKVLKANPKIEYIEKDALVCAIQGEFIPWGIAKIEPEEFFLAGNLGQGIKVGLLDTGIDYEHFDLSKNYAGGYNFISPKDLPKDDHGHGTHCAGIIAAARNNKGIIGIAPEAKIYAIKVINKSGVGRYSDIIAGIQWAVENKLDILSMSFGSYIYSRALQQACQQAYNKNIVMVAATGNDGKGEVMYPAKYDEVIAVGAVDENNEVPEWSNYGYEVELVAPGYNILSTYRDYYSTFWGTSMACPHVTGVAALIMAAPIPSHYDTNHNKIWEPVEVRACLRDAAIDLGAAGKDIFYGYGLVNAKAAALLSNNLPCVLIEDLQAPEKHPAGNPVLISLAVANKGSYAAAVTVDLVDEATQTLIETKLVEILPKRSLNLFFECATDEIPTGTSRIIAQVFNKNILLDQKLATITLN